MTVKRMRMCYWIAGPAKPGVQSSNTSRVHFTVISYTPGHSRFYHINIVSKRIWDGACLMNLTQRSSLFFLNLQFVPLRCWISVKHAIQKDVTWWHCGARYCYYADTTVQHYDVMQFQCVLWCNTMHEWVMNIHYQTWIDQGRFINISRTPSKQWGVCDNKSSNTDDMYQLKSTFSLSHLI